VWMLIECSVSSSIQPPRNRPEFSQLRRILPPSDIAAYKNPLDHAVQRIMYLQYFYIRARVYNLNGAYSPTG
ncbi:hypothetical protein, partial [Anaerotruncus colihominis]|uniref:hypothetical protein n=1 Tax=Anaerotruncus colihominis TaxID=169435 RepID=UPI001A9C1DEF